jgi:hypothetical protein
MEHADLGLTLHPFDLATNKVLALIGRLEPRDWIDVIHASDAIQPLGFLAWAASGKDPGVNPAMVLAEARRSGRYTALEIEELAFEGSPPDAGDLSRRWAAMLRVAEATIELLPAEHVGTCVLDPGSGLFKGGPPELRQAMGSGRLVFHRGSIRGAFPQILPPRS